MCKSTIVTLLTLALMLLGASTSVQAQKTLLTQFVEPGVSTPTDVENGLVTYSRITWTTSSTITACSFKMERSDDGISWIEDLTPVLDCTLSGRFEFITPLLGKFIRYDVSVLTGDGFLTPLWEGLRGVECGRNYSGIFSVVTSSDPSAGTELSISVPSSEKWRVYSSSFELQADSTVEDREVFLVVSQGSDEYFRTFADGVVKANQLGIFTSAPIGFVGTAGLGPSSINQPTDVRTIMIPIYSDAFIPGGHTLATDTGGLQSGDDYSPVVVLVERCPN